MLIEKKSVSLQRQLFGKMKHCLPRNRGLRRVAVWAVLVWLAGVRVCAQTGDGLYGYRYYTGVDSSMWEYPTSVTTGASGNLPIIDGFDFYFWGERVWLMSLSSHGLIYINHSFVSEFAVDTLFSSALYLSRAPFLAPVGNSGDVSVSSWRNWQSGDEGSRVYVLELELQVGYGDTQSYRLAQVQLREEDQSVTFVYGELWDTNEVDMMLGLAGSDTEFVVVDQRTNTADVVGTNDLGWRGWPGAWRYYRFMPECMFPHTLWVNMLTTTSARVGWRGHGRFWVEYDTTGFALGSGIGQVVEGNELILQDLSSDVSYDVYVRAYCGDSLYGPWLMVQYMPYCEIANGSVDRIRCWELERENVIRRNGNFFYPNINLGGEVGQGFLSSASFHYAIHDDPDETDIYTGNVLHTVPPGHCRSVRLGNRQAGMGQESVEYRMVVDTTDFDLLILNYAIVEENPSHPGEEQPYFTFGIYDTLGNLIGNCYFANFVAGDMSGWNEYNFGDGGPFSSNIVWRDWSAVGVDLTSMHGQTVCVKLSNADCRLGGHFGYGYYTLESAHKRLRLAACGDAEENTLYAPKGFTYRWYRAYSPEDTLSTADSLHVASGGYYCCEATYQLSGQSCSFTVSAYAGERYPVASFSTEFLDSCGRHVQFVNESFVAHDSARTLTSTEPCERYRWEVDGVAFSELASPMYEFDEGVHTVTLYAILGDGQCVDSVSHTVAVVLHHDTVYDTICRHESYRWYGSDIIDSGAYYVVDQCDGHLLRLAYRDTVSTMFEDTVWLGTVYQYDGESFTAPGTYRKVMITSEGCDSIRGLRLSSIEQHDTILCESGMPLLWRGAYFEQGGRDTLNLRSVAETDSIVMLAVSVRQHPVVQLDAEPYCEEGGYYIVPLSDTLAYRWMAQPVDGQLPSGVLMGRDYPDGLRLVPEETTEYYVVVDYVDSPQCPITDTVVLEPVDVVSSLLEVSLLEPSEDNPVLTARDMGDTSWRREWYVNGVLQAEEGSRLVYRVGLEEDSLVVMLINYSELCSDTAYARVGTRRQELWFPNVFTPDEATNNVFRGYGVNIIQYDLQIYTKWGNCIFYTRNIEDVWDGTYNGVRSPVSAYVYKCTYVTDAGKKKVVVGTVTLLR